MAATMNPTETVANRLCELCAQGKHMEAMAELYADNARHVEAFVMPDSPQPRIVEGKQALMQAAEHFFGNLEVHDMGIGKPYPHDDTFIVEQWMSCTFKEGPMAGQKFDMREMAHYTVADGKITEAKFYYGMDH